MSLADIADLMGHKDLATTQIYAKVEQQHLRSVVTKLTPLVPVDVSPESVTWKSTEQIDDRKVLKMKDLVGTGRELAERVGFEPTLEFPLNTLSKRAPSATRPSLRRGSFEKIVRENETYFSGSAVPGETLPLLILRVRARSRKHFAPYRQQVKS